MHYGHHGARRAYAFGRRGSITILETKISQGLPHLVPIGRDPEWLNLVYEPGKGTMYIIPVYYRTVFLEKIEKQRV